MQHFHVRYLAQARLFLAWVVSLSSLFLVSCSSRPPAVSGPDIDPESAASAAIEAFDVNHDGALSGDEFAKSPALGSALKRIDTNADGSASADEIAQRIGNWQASGIALTSFGFTVTLDGRPLEGATVTFEPEAFLGDSIKSASCQTNVSGGGGASIPKEMRGDPSDPPGMHLGFYKVKISKLVDGAETIPAKYNTETVLSQEVALDVPEMMNNRVVYALETK